MMALLDRRVIAAIGGGVAVLLAIVFAFLAFHGHKADPAKTQASAGGLQIEQGQADSRTSTTKPLRCFVNGQFVGMATVAECAQKNGVAAQALDVGLDPATGQVTDASGSLAPPVQPAPAAPPAAAPEPSPEQAAAAPAPIGECLRYAQDGWRTVGSGVVIGQCARTLFDGRCVRSGEVLYGRWGSQTLRLVPGRVDLSPDNRNFHPLVSQNPDDCSLPQG